ncbi:replication endonuclease [Roseateles sp. MS17]
MPIAWAEKLLERWRGRRALNSAGANLEHLNRCRAINAAHHAGVPADANDGRICQEAAELARDTSRRLDHIDRIAAVELADREPEQRERLLMLGRTLEAMHWLGLRQVQAGFMRHASRSIPAALKRLGCERWWRAVLRGLHARAVESTARAIGLVHKRAGCYVSDDTLKRRQGQRARNARALESVRAVNEHGQDYTLAELAAKGPANREIRRHELMTRIAGFELIAKECGHAAYFVTVTCPSRMHAWRTKAGQSWAVGENPRHDGTLPDAAQAYLCQQWRRFRAAADRAGLDLYGFRIAEPNHDATPHWHALLFFPETAVPRGRRQPGRPREAYRVMVRLLRRYFLHNDSANERGARRHRCKVERIDWQRGSAAGYIAKYVAKNIDGYKVEKDLYGNDTLTSSQRVDAWASTWRIRQFQQIGGAPVGVWRELRRLHPEQAAASAVVAFGLDAANLTAMAQESASEPMQRYTAANGWAGYVMLQGGHRPKRGSLRLKVLRESTGELGRYGEAMPPRAVGVVTAETVREIVPAFGIVKAYPQTRQVRREVESERATWLIVPGGFVEQARQRLKGSQAGGAAARPWSPVNNCTRPAPLFAPSVERIKKRGRWHRWKSRAGGLKEGNDHAEIPPP